MSHEVAYPVIHSEFEVQAHLYGALRSLGYDVRGEVRAFSSSDKKRVRPACRLDLVIFRGTRAVLIIEVKKSDVRHNTTFEDTRQGTRYPHFGVPVWVVYGYDGADTAVDEVQRFLGASYMRKHGGASSVKQEA